MSSSRRVMVAAFKELGTEVFSVWEKLIHPAEKFIHIGVSKLFGDILSNVPPELNGWGAYVRERYASIIPEGQEYPHPSSV